MNGEIGFVDKIMERIVEYAYCNQCGRCSSNCSNSCKAEMSCFQEHPGWVSIAPHNLRRVLEIEYKKFKRKGVTDRR